MSLSHSLLYILRYIPWQHPLLIPFPHLISCVPPFTLISVFLSRLHFRLFTLLHISLPYSIPSSVSLPLLCLEHPFLPISFPLFCFLFPSIHTSSYFSLLHLFSPLLYFPSCSSLLFKQFSSYFSSFLMLLPVSFSSSYLSFSASPLHSFGHSLSQDEPKLSATHKRCRLERLSLHAFGLLLFDK